MFKVLATALALSVSATAYAKCETDACAIYSAAFPEHNTDKNKNIKEFKKFSEQAAKRSGDITAKDAMVVSFAAGVMIRNCRHNPRPSNPNVLLELYLHFKVNEQITLEQFLASFVEMACNQP